jgi:tetratricopeptide (TPR) repeat protein
MSEEQLDSAPEMPPSAGKIATERQAQLHFEAGNDFYKQSKYIEAGSEYQKAIELNPGYAIAYNNWANALYDQEKYGEAIEKYQKAIELNPEYADAYYNWGLALYEQKKYGEAIEKYQKAIELNPGYADAYNNWGLALGNQKTHAEAIEKYQKAIELNPGYADAYNNWGLALYGQKKHGEAIEKYQKVIELDPGDAIAYNNWGNVLYEQKKYGEAIEKYQKAIELNPGYAIAYNNWGLALGNQKTYTEASEKYQKATELDPEYADAYNNWGLALYEQKKYGEAIEKYQKAIELNPGYADAYNNWGNALYDQKKYGEAIERFQKATELDANYGGAYFNWGNALGEQFRYEAAIDKFYRAVRTNEDDFYPYHNIAHYLWTQGKYEAAREAWEQTRRVYERTLDKAKESGNADHFYYYGSVLLDVFGELKEAEEIFEEGLKLNPDHVGILSSLVGLYLERKDEKAKKENAAERAAMHWKARECYRKAERLLRDQLLERADASVLVQLGELLLKMEEPDEIQEEKYAQAEKFFKSALDLDRESASIYNDLGVVYTRRDDFKRAIQYFELALGQDPDNLNSWSNLAELYLKSKRKEKAETEYLKILRITSGHIESQIGLGEVYSAMGDDGDNDMYEKAVSYFTTGINLAEAKLGSKRLKRTELAAPYYSRGYARVKLYESSKPVGDSQLLQDAQNDFERCCSLDPDNHKAGRAIAKLKKKLRWFAPNWLTERVGPWLILVPAFIILGLSQASFFVGWPVKSISISFYSTSTFGSFIFIVVGLYLPQILKLKVAGIELEKSSVEHVTTSVSLGITR